MLLTLLKSKIHGATVTGTNLEYTGSITIDGRLVEASGLCANEKVLVSDMTNGNRFETYVIVGGEGVVEVNGAAAKLVNSGDRIIVMAFGMFPQKESKKHKPKVISVDGRNRVRPARP
jgi:aspartate 1-decarboxylase